VGSHRYPAHITAPEDHQQSRRTRDTGFTGDSFTNSEQLLGYSHNANLLVQFTAQCRQNSMCQHLLNVSKSPIYTASQKKSHLAIILTHMVWLQ